MISIYNIVNVYTKDVVRRPLRLNIVSIMEATFDMDENIVQIDVLFDMEK